MENKENKKSFEALPDEALDAVSGGAFEINGICEECHQPKKVTLYQYEQKGKARLLCSDCIAGIKKANK